MANPAPVVADVALSLAYNKLYLQEKAKNPSLSPTDFTKSLFDSAKSSAAAAKPNAKGGKK